MASGVINLITFLATTVLCSSIEKDLRIDLVIFGATPAGIAAAITAASSSRSSPVNVALVVSGKTIGGMMTGGLGWDDVFDVHGLHASSSLNLESEASPRSHSIYGNASVYTQFADKVQQYYASISQRALNLSVYGTRHEPRVALAIFEEMLATSKIQVIYATGLPTVKMTDDNVSIESVMLQNRSSPTQMLNLFAKVFIDASYEGDLLHAAGAPNRVGREGRSEYAELNAGVVFTDNVKHSFLRGSTGAASKKVPAMTWRLCFTTNASNRVDISRPPASYNRSLYLGYVDDVNHGRLSSVWHAWSGPRPLPPHGTKFDINCNPRPLGFIWAGDQKDRYIISNETERQALVTELQDLTLGLLYFQQNDDAVPTPERTANKRFGLCKDEFQDNGNFPTQLYIREARRLTSLRQFSEHDMVPISPSGRPPLRPDSIAVGSFPIDSFPCTNTRPSTAQQSSATALEGYIGMESDMIAPSTLPVGFTLNAKVTNLIVSTAVGCTHVAFSSVRLEPTWMLVGGAVGELAAIALANRHDEENSSVDIMRVPLLELQRSVVARQPLLLYDDLSPSSPHYMPMQLLGPHGVADDGDFSARPDAALSRARATRWLLGAALAINSTVMHVAKAPSPSPSHTHWRDFGPGDEFFDSAIACAQLGAFPLPDPQTRFDPTANITDDDWREWVGKMLHVSVLPSPNPPLLYSRGDAAEVLYHAVVRVVKA